MQNSILNTTVSAFRDYETTFDPQPVNLLLWLTSKKYAEKVNAIRKEEDKAVRDTIKATLPAITPSGIFSYRAARCLIAHSAFIQFDIDFKENSHISNYEDLKTEICKIVNIAYCGLSVSGTGFWGLIPIAYPDKHRQHFDFIYNAFKDIGITIDKKPRNVAALRGYSYDADAYFNHDAKTLQQYHQPKQKPNKATLYSYNGNSIQNNVEALINEITKKGTDLTPNYNEWLNIGFALSHEFGEAGRQYFHDVSGTYAGYDRTETDNQYTKCLQAGASSTPITIKTFFRKCKDAGIVLAKAGKKTEARTERFKIKSRQEHLLNIHSNDFFYDREGTYTDETFQEIIIYHYEDRTGNVYEFLYNKNGELIRPGEQAEAVKNLEIFFEKNLIKATFDGSPCWVQIANFKTGTEWQREKEHSPLRQPHD
jgi:hypothetical protein